MLNEKYTEATQYPKGSKALDESATRHSSVRAQPAVELNIEELVLQGFADSDRYRIGESVERELARLFIEHGVPPSLMRQSSELPPLGSLTFDILPDEPPETIGAQVAQAIYGGFHQ